MTSLREYEMPTDRAFAAQPINLAIPDERLYLQRAVATAKQTSEKAWDWYDKIGEVRYGISRSARIAGYTKLGAARFAPDGTKERDASDRSVVAGIVKQIYSPYGGVRHFVERFYMLMKIPADGYLVRNRTPQGVADGYLIISPSEMDNETLSEAGRHAASAAGIRWRSIPGNGNGSEMFNRVVKPEDFISRIWVPHARYVDVPDSPMNALSTECEVLHRLTESMKGRILSRFAMAGIMLIPSEMSEAKISGPTPEANPTNDKVLDYLIAAWTRNITMHDQASMYAPIALKGPAEVLDKVRLLVPEGTIAESDLKFRAELIGRILTGLDVQKNATEGLGDTNHWAAWAVSDEERRITVQPDLEMMCFALTRTVLWPALLALKWPPERVWPWRITYDLSEAAVRSNPSEDFRLGWDRGWISDDSGRRVIGATETDKPTDEEYVRWTGRQLKDPYLSLFGLDVDVDWSKVGTLGKPPGPAADSPAGDSNVGPGEDPGSPESNDSDTPRSQRPG